MATEQAEKENNADWLVPTGSLFSTGLQTLRKIGRAGYQPILPIFGDCFESRLQVASLDDPSKPPEGGTQNDLKRFSERGAAMLINAHNLKGAAIIARDGAIGEGDDFYFDDKKWTVRYLVVNTGAWLFRRDVLVSPISIKKVNEANNQVLVNLTRDQVKDSPDIDTQKPVSRQHETAFMNYYGYPYYWGGPYLWGDSAFPATLAMPPAVESQMAAAASRQRASEESYDEHLRSVNEVKGYHIEAADGEIGHVDDFIIDDRDWAIRFIVIKTGGWLSGRKTLVSPQSIEGISWTESKMFVSLTRDQIASGPEYIEDRGSRIEDRELRIDD